MCASNMDADQTDGQHALDVGAAQCTARAQVAPRIGDNACIASNTSGARILAVSASALF